MPSQNLTLRESKRLATRSAIFNNAARLVAERSFDEVTVDDICLEVGISKRTFFNYVDSKEQAVIGAPPADFTEEEIAEFSAAPQADLLGALTRLAGDRLLAEWEGMSNDDAVALLKLRKTIISDNPRLAIQRMSHTHRLMDSLTRACVRYLETYPQTRRLQAAVEHEAETYVALAITSVQLGVHQWASSGASTLDALVDSCGAALHNITHVLRSPANPQ